MDVIIEKWGVNSAPPAISNHGLETTVYRSLGGTFSRNYAWNSYFRSISNLDFRAWCFLVRSSPSLSLRGSEDRRSYFWNNIRSELSSSEGALPSRTRGRFATSAIFCPPPPPKKTKSAFDAPHVHPRERRLRRPEQLWAHRTKPLIQRPSLLN